MMKVLALVSSFRKNGNTSNIVKLVGQGLQDEASRQGIRLEFETIYLGHMNIQICRGCRVCFDRGEQFCPLKDDIKLITAKMEAADGFIIASPVYVGDVNGVMKNWIDRLAYICHRPEFADKAAYIVATTGGSPTGHTIKSMQGALLSWGAYLVGQMGFKMGAKMEKALVEDQFKKQAENIALKLFRAIQHQKYRRPPFVSLMMFKILQWHRSRTPSGSLDHTYWTQQGWTDPTREYYLPHRTDRLTTFLARIVGTFFAKMFA